MKTYPCNIFYEIFIREDMTNLALHVKKSKFKLRFDIIVDELGKNPKGMESGTIIVILLAPIEWFKIWCHEMFCM
jgi:hypothetical protein